MCIEKEETSIAEAQKQSNLIEISERSGAEKERKSPLIASCFNVFYFLLYIPFKTQFDFDKNCYTLKTSKIQQMACGVLHFICLGYMVTAVVTLVKQIESYDTACIMSIFYIASCFGWLFSGGGTIYMLWWNRQGYLQVLEHTRFQFGPDANSKRLVALLAVFVPITYLCTGIISFYVIQEQRFLEGHMTEHKFQVPQNVHSGSKESPEFYRHTFNYFIPLAFTYFNQFYSSCITLMFMLVVTLNRLAGELESTSKQGVDIDNGIKLYRNIKQCMVTVRGVFGRTLVGFFIASVSYLAQAPHILFGKRGETERCLMVYFLLSGVIWILAAEFHLKIRNIFTSWTDSVVYDGESGESSDDKIKVLKMSAELTSDNCNAVAVGSSYFLVTYKHLSSMLGLILTYGIVIFQLHRSSE